jgi:Zn-dependent peptidase ImmA (M78 family)
MAFRRGFKTEANDIARDIRGELGLRMTDPLDPWNLAEYLNIPIINLSDFATDAPRAASYFSQTDSSAFSAVTVFHGTKRTIVHNDAHLPGRQANNVSHEISHGLLQHPPTPALDDHGCRNWNKDVEDEAAWLGAALLVSEEAALTVVRQRMPVDQAAEKYGVSPELMTMRINVTGARKRVGRY